MFSSIKQKRRAVQQRPGQVLRHFQAVTRGVKLHRRLFLLGRGAAQARQVNLFDEFLVVLFFLDQFRDNEGGSWLAAVGPRAPGFGAIYRAFGIALCGRPWLKSRWREGCR